MGASRWALARNTPAAVAHQDLEGASERGCVERDGDLLDVVAKILEARRGTGHNRVNVRVKGLPEKAGGGESNAQRPRVLVRGRGVRLLRGRQGARAAARVEQCGRVANRAGHRELADKALRWVIVPARKPATTRLEADETAGRGRNADRAAPVGGVGNGDDSGGHGGGRAPAGASG